MRRQISKFLSLFALGKFHSMGHFVLSAGYVNNRRRPILIHMLAGMLNAGNTAFGYLY